MGKQMIQKAPIFQSQQLQQQFDDQGYVIVRLLNDIQIQKLRDLYYNVANINLDEDFKETTRQLGDESNQIISDTIKEEFESSCGELLNNFSILGGTYFIKRPEGKTEFPIHQDWNMVNEAEYYGALIWCPLQDVIKENGALVVIPGSHNFFETYRSGSIHPPRFPHSVFSDKKMEHALETVELKAGEALIYQNSLYHGSHPNHSLEDRLVATSSLISANARLVYYHWPDEQHPSIQVIDAKDDFYLKHIDNIAIGKLPDDAPVVATVNTQPFYPKVSDLMDKVQNQFPRKRMNFLKRWWYGRSGS